MKKHNVSLPEFDKSWSLFLDRDGVINEKRDNDYVKSWEEFKFLEGSKDAINKLSEIFGTIVIVTNQQGIGKGLFTNEQLNLVHEKMLAELHNPAAIKKIYFCPDLAHNNPVNRKPNTGMAIQAQADFPSINFSKSVMVGDSHSDMEFGHRLGMFNVFISSTRTDSLSKLNCPSLLTFADLLTK